MHVISNDTALAHWQALNGLPVAALNLLKTRFLREQPILASIVLPLADGLVTGPDGQEKLRDEDDPKMADFWRLATTGAIMNEILCREAGCPLRRLGDEEVNAVADETLALFEQLAASKPARSASLRMFSPLARSAICSAEPPSLIASRSSAAGKRCFAMC